MKLRAKQFKQAGFTLVELLVALMVFSLLTTFAFRSVNMLSVAQTQLDAEQELLSSLQKTLLIWERDVRQHTPVFPKAGSGEPDQEDVLMTLETFASAGLKGSMPKIETVVYTYKDGVLSRQIGKKADVDKASPIPLIKGLSHAEMVLKKEGEGTASGIVLSLQHESLGTIQRVAHLFERHWKDAPDDPLVDENQTGSGGGDGTGPATVITPPDPDDPDAGEAIW